MFTNDTLADAASAILIAKAEPQVLADTMLRASEFPAVVAECDLLLGGVVKPMIDKPEGQVEGVQLETSPKTAVPENIRYYDLKRNWTKKILPYLDDDQLNDILDQDFNKFTWGRWRMKFRRDEFPYEFETCYWEFGHRGPAPRFWMYVKHGACHWIVNFALRLATLVVPSRSWRIITSQTHSTVWDGQNLLFDFNYLAMGIPADECFESASDQELSPGEYLEVGFPND
jgi:hypothetical protein